MPRTPALVHYCDDMTASVAAVDDERQGEHRSWVRLSGVDVRAGARGPTVKAATFAHQYYRSLVDGYLSNSWSITVARITRRCLKRAVDDLADLIISARKASRWARRTKEDLQAQGAGVRRGAACE